MPTKPKINSKRQIELLKDCYIDRKMSTVDIENQSEKLFGFYVSRGTIYRALIKHEIVVRCKSESVSRSMSTLDIDQSFVNERVIEWVDGFNLGDGYIQFRKGDYMNARFVIGSSTKNWTKYGMSFLSAYRPSAPKYHNKINERHPNPIWTSRTRTHPDIVGQAKRWYPNGKKVVPKDVRITPTSILLWHLGDGSLTYNKRSNICQVRLATCSFSCQEINDVLIPKLTSSGIRATHYESKNDIHICADSIRRFFDIIGRKSPVPEYQHKFDYPEWLGLI